MHQCSCHMKTQQTYNNENIVQTINTKKLQWEAKTKNK